MQAIKQKFLVTGGAGFIGSHLTEQLLLDGHQVIVVDNLSTGQRANLPKHPDLFFLEKDVNNLQPEDLADFSQIAGIAHLAAIPSVTESWLNPLTVHQNNLSATVHIIELCEKLSIPRLTMASSAAVYGNIEQLPITENLPTKPISPYGLQKLVSEQYASLFASHYNFSFVSLRLFNVFGPRQRADSPYSGVISIFSSLMQQGKDITIYGDGSQTRDFIFVKDVAIAFVQALTVNLNIGETFICNIGTGKSTSLLQLIDGLQLSITNWSGQIKFESSRLGDIQHSLANIDQANRILNFFPAWSINSGLQALITSDQQ
jgi:UDP-glucose 4-epimerase